MANITALDVFFPNAGWRLSRLRFLPCCVEKTRQLQQRALGWQKVAATAAARNCYVNMAQQRLEERKNEIHLLFVLFVHISSFERALRPFSLFLATSSDNRIGFSRVVVVVFVPQSVLCITTTTSKNPRSSTGSQMGKLSLQSGCNTNKIGKCTSKLNIKYSLSF